MEYYKLNIERINQAKPIWPLGAFTLHLTIYLTLTISIIVICLLIAAPKHYFRGHESMPDIQKFLQVNINSKTQNDCTPELPEISWKGILIAAPETAHLLDKKSDTNTSVPFEFIPICGVARVDEGEIFGHPVMRIVVKDEAENDTYTARIDYSLLPGRRNERVAAPYNITITKEDVAGIINKTYFNPNLYDFIKLPRRPAVYSIKVIQGSYESNEIKLNVIE